MVLYDGVLQIEVVEDILPVVEPAVEFLPADGFSGSAHRWLPCVLVIHHSDVYTMSRVV